MTRDREIAGECDVRKLFNQKADRWEEKYAPDGPLRPRLNRFTECVAKEVRPGGRILDLGCGTGSLARHLSTLGYLVTAADIAEAMIDQGTTMCQPGAVSWRLLPTFWNRLPFESNAFDAIVASSVFEYVHSVDVVLAECRRTLKPGGCIIFTAPNPHHYVRKVESFLRPVAVGMLHLRVFGLVPRIASYLIYLQASRNRMSAAGWQRAAACSGLTVCEHWLEAKSPLMRMRCGKPLGTGA